MSHDDFQPPEHDEPALDDDDRMYGALADLASIDTHDVNLRDHPKAYEILDRLMTHAYAEGRKDEAEARSVEYQPGSPNFDGAAAWNASHDRARDQARSAAPEGCGPQAAEPGGEATRPEIGGQEGAAAP